MKSPFEIVRAYAQTAPQPIRGLYLLTISQLGTMFLLIGVVIAKDFKDGIFGPNNKLELFALVASIMIANWIVISCAKLIHELDCGMFKELIKIKVAIFVFATTAIVAVMCSQLL